MSGKSDTKPPNSQSQDRDARLKAALKANLQRRKQQARARDASEQAKEKE